MFKKICVMLLLIIPLGVTAATCDAFEQTELITLASLIELNYEEYIEYTTEDVLTCPESIDPDFCDEFLTDETYQEYWPYVRYLKVNLLNLTDDLYVVMTSDVLDFEFTVYADDLKDGVYTLLFGDLSYVHNLTFTFYATSETGCEDEKIYTQYLTLPKYNELSEYSMCDNLADSAVCQIYTMNDSLTYSDLSDKYAAYLEELSASLEDDSTSEDGGEYLIYIIGGLSGLIIVSISGVVIYKKRSGLK